MQDVLALVCIVCTQGAIQRKGIGMARTILMGVCFASLAAVMAFSVLADDAAVKADALTNTVDPYNVADQKTKFTKLSGNTGELDAKTFDADRKAGGNLVMPFEKWETAAAFDKNKNSTLDWFEFDAYRQAMRKAVLAACDKNKDGKLTGDERAIALKLLAEGKLEIKPEPERPVAMPPMAGPFGGGAPAAGGGPDRNAIEQMHLDFRTRMDEINGRIATLNKRMETEKGTLSAEERQALAKAIDDAVAESDRAVEEFRKAMSTATRSKEQQARDREQAWNGLPKSLQGFLARNAGVDGDGNLDDAKREAAFAFMMDLNRANTSWTSMMNPKDATPEQQMETMKKWQPVIVNLQKDMLKRVDPDGDGTTPPEKIAPEKWRAFLEKFLNGQVRYMERFEKQVLADNGGKPNDKTRAALIQAIEADLRERVKKADANNNGILDPEEGEKFFRELMDEMLKEE